MERINCLRQIAIFKNALNSTLLSILFNMEEIEVQKGAYLYKINQSLEYIYFILEGDIEIQKLVSVFMNDRNSKKGNSKSDLDLLYRKGFNQIFKIMRISLLGKYQYLGEEEIVQKEQNRTFQALCVSEYAKLYKINNKVLFFKLLQIYFIEQKKELNRPFKDE